MQSERRKVVLTGATGFVGRHVYPALARAGYEVRCITRRADAARSRWPEREWMAADLGSVEDLRRALTDANAALYLVHGMAEGERQFRQREVEAAERFAQVAYATGLARIVYLGGVAPDGPPSEHLLSRIEVGEALRRGSVPVIELRASMIIGHGSASWLMVRDLAARLPVMILPRWLESRTEPVGIDDVVAGLLGALSLPITKSECFDIPGPEALSGREILERTARVLGHDAPRVLRVPLLSPWLSSHWIRLVTRADWPVARELVSGLTTDILARDGRFWEKIGHTRLMSFEEAARAALSEESLDPPPRGAWGAVEHYLGKPPKRRGRRDQSSRGADEPRRRAL